MSEDTDFDGAPVYRLCIKCGHLKTGVMYDAGVGTVCETCR